MLNALPFLCDHHNKYKREVFNVENRIVMIIPLYLPLKCKIIQQIHSEIDFQNP